MDRRILINNAEFIFSKDAFGYQDILNDFRNASEINIVTFNFSDDYGELNNLIKNLDKSVVVNIITNIPGSHHIWDREKGKDTRKNARKMMEKLDFNKYKCNVNAYINVSNHSKIIMTNNICYVGSSNYSSFSKKSYECGFIIKDANEINDVKTIVNEIISTSIPIIGENSKKIVAELKEYIQEIDLVINDINERFNCFEARIRRGIMIKNFSEKDTISDQEIQCMFETFTFTEWEKQQIDGIIADVKKAKSLDFDDYIIEDTIRAPKIQGGFGMFSICKREKELLEGIIPAINKAKFLPFDNYSGTDVTSEKESQQIEELLDKINRVTQFLKSKNILDNIGNKMSEDLINFAECSFMISKTLLAKADPSDLMMIEGLHEDYIDELTLIQRKLKEMVDYLKSLNVEKFNESIYKQ